MIPQIFNEQPHSRKPTYFLSHPKIHMRKYTEWEVVSLWNLSSVIIFFNFYCESWIFIFLENIIAYITKHLMNCKCWKNQFSKFMYECLMTEVWKQVFIFLCVVFHKKEFQSLDSFKHTLYLNTIITGSLIIHVSPFSTYVIYIYINPHKYVSTHWSWYRV